ncbi:MAG: class I SAM-dependent methyltransferase [Chloroflexota bacterium]
MTQNDKITFSFGENWLNYLDTVTQERYQQAYDSLANLLDLEDLTGQTFLDIGCGSGLFSASALSMNAQKVISVDVDPKSVQATQSLKEQRHDVEHWQVLHGSILDDAFVSQLEPADVLYSWGVLHHTGEMWRAIDNASKLVKPDGLFIIAIYNKHRTSEFWLRYKRLYNSSGTIGKQALAWTFFIPRMASRLVKGKHPLREKRGMSVYYDVIDWVGGLPYEYASFDEIMDFCQARGFTLQKSIPTSSIGCNQFVFRLEE